MNAVLATLPLHLVCHLIVPGAPSLNNTNFVNQSSSEVRPASLPDGYVPPAGAKVALLASLPLQVICQILVTNSLGVTENNTLVWGETSESDIQTVEPEGLQLGTTTRPATLPPGYVTFSDVNAVYRLHGDEQVAWNQARDRCIAEGAHLAIPDSVEKIVHINSLNSSSSYLWLHAGIFRSNITDQWTRVDNGLPATSIPWIEGEPDGSGDCVGVLVGADPGLVDYTCAKTYGPYVCEMSTREE